jgi:hypothetical protein
MQRRARARKPLAKPRMGSHITVAITTFGVAAPAILASLSALPCVNLLIRYAGQQSKASQENNTTSVLVSDVSSWTTHVDAGSEYLYIKILLPAWVAFCLRCTVFRC